MRESARLFAVIIDNLLIFFISHFRSIFYV